MTTNEFKQQVYRVMVTVLAIPDADQKIVADICGLSLLELSNALEFADTEGLLSGLRILPDDLGKEPIFIYDRAQRTLKGLDFMGQFEAEGVPHITGDERPTVFISYNQASASSFADSLQARLKTCATVVRDKTSMNDWESFTSFMKSIRKQDFAVLAITPEYLRSIACMYEVSELLKDENWRDKVMFAVIDSSIYSTPVSEFLTFWQDKEKDLREQANKLDPENMSLVADDLNKVITIKLCFNRFYDAVRDSNNPMPWDIIHAVIQRIKICTNDNFAAGLDNSIYAKEREEQIRKALE